MDCASLVVFVVDVQRGCWRVTGEKVYLCSMWSQALVTRLLFLNGSYQQLYEQFHAKRWGYVPLNTYLMLHHIVWGARSHRQSYWSSEAALNFGSAEWLQGGCLEPKCLHFPPGSFHSHWVAPPPHLLQLLVPPLRPLYHHCHSLMCHCWSSLCSLGWWGLCIECPWCNCDHQRNPK